MDASPAFRVLIHPFREYAQLADARPQDSPTIGEGVLRLLFVVGAVVAMTASGRLAPIELGVAMVSFAYVPAAQFIALSIAIRAVPCQVERERTARGS